MHLAFMFNSKVKLIYARIDTISEDFNKLVHNPLIMELAHFRVTW
jgi:hypothetical protein